MTEKKVKCIVKGPKGLWGRNGEGNTKHYKDGDKIELSAESAASKRARGNVYATGEYEGKLAEAAAQLKASQDEKEARKAEKAPEKAPEKVQAGAGSKGS